MKKARWIPPVVLSGAGVLILGYCCFIRTDSWIFQQKALEAERLSMHAPGSGVSNLVGRITIPRVGVSAIIVEGSDDAALRRAVGHIGGTALPGRPGNIGLAAHRDTFFRALRDIRLGDTIVLTTGQKDFRYLVVSTKVVDPHAVEVLNPMVGETLTLVTCYPFYFVGAAPNRFIVRAERTRTHP